MKHYLKFGLFAVICLMATVGFAQDTPADNPAQDVWDKIIGHLEVIIPAVLVIVEALLRLVPTLKDYSILNKIVAVLQWISDKFLPNKSKQGGNLPNSSVIKATVSDGKPETKERAIQAVQSTPTK